MNGNTTLSACKTLADFRRTREFRDILLYCETRCEEAAEAYQHGIAQFVRNFGQFRGLRLVVSLLRINASEEAMLDMDNEICGLGDELNRLAYYDESDGSTRRAQDRLIAERAQYKVDLGAFQTRASRRFFSPVPVVYKPQPQQSRGKQTKKASGSAEKAGDEGSGDSDPDPDPESSPLTQQFLAHLTAFRRDPSAPVANPLSLSVAVLRLNPTLSPREQHLVDSHTASELQRLARKISGLARRRPWGSLVSKEERDATALGLAHALFLKLVNNSPEKFWAIVDTALESMIFAAINSYHSLDTAAEFSAAPVYLLGGEATLAAKAAKAGRLHHRALQELEASGADARTLHEARKKYEADVAVQRVEYASSLDALLEDRGDRDFSRDQKLSSDEISGGVSWNPGAVLFDSAAGRGRDGPSATRDTPDSLHTLAMSDEDEVLRFGPESERAEEDIEEYLACPESTSAPAVDEDAPAVPLTPAKIAESALQSPLPPRLVVSKMLDVLRETNLHYLRVTRVAERILTAARKGNVRATELLRELVNWGGLAGSVKTLSGVEDFLVSADAAMHNHAVQSYCPLVAEALARTDDFQAAMDAVVDALTFPEDATDAEEATDPLPERIAIAVAAHAEFWSPLPPARRLYIPVTQEVPELPPGAVPPSLDPPEENSPAPASPRKPRLRASLPSDDPPEYVSLLRLSGRMEALAWTAC